jgi:hypothetical protein
MILFAALLLPPSLLYPSFGLHEKEGGQVFAYTVTNQAINVFFKVGFLTRAFASVRSGKLRPPLSGANAGNSKKSVLSSRKIRTEPRANSSSVYGGRYSFLTIGSLRTTSLATSPSGRLSSSSHPVSHPLPLFASARE